MTIGRVSLNTQKVHYETTGSWVEKAGERGLGKIKMGKESVKQGYYLMTQDVEDYKEEHEARRGLGSGKKGNSLGEG